VITGYNPDTDTVETSGGDYLFTENRSMARVTRRLPDGQRLKLAMDERSFIEPAPYEFLWVPRKALGVLDVWWSVINSVDLPGSAEVTYETGEGSWRQLVSRELVQDSVAWAACQQHLFERFLLQWQHAIDAASGVNVGEFSASE